MSMYNITVGSNNLVDRVFEIIGLKNKDPQTEEEEELCDIGFVRYRDTTVMENFSLLKITTRTGGGNRLEYKETIRDIRDHSLYVDDCDWPADETYAWFYLRIPESKRGAVRALYPTNYAPPSLDREFAEENKVWNKLNNPNYEDSESDTDYSDESDFTSRYGYWKNDVGISESDDYKSNDSMDDTSDTKGDTPMEVSESILEMMKGMKF
jgi:hypothetical protein